jgi:hypothetical protein
MVQRTDTSKGLRVLTNSCGVDTCILVGLSNVDNMAEAPSGELPRLASGIQWSVEPASNEEVKLFSRQYFIAAQKSGLYSIDEDRHGPLISIGTRLRSNFAIAIGGAAYKKYNEGEIHEKNFDDEDMDPGATWIPYQESFHIQEPKETTPHRFKHITLRDVSNSSTFTYATPKEVFNYMLQSTSQFHDNYDDVLNSIHDSNFDCQAVLFSRAPEVLSSGDYTRERFQNNFLFSI